MIDKLDTVASQMREIISSAEIEEVAMFTCSCGFRLPLRHGYRCFYCGEFYCYSCAERHFGKSRKEYYKEEENKKNE